MNYRPALAALGLLLVAAAPGARAEDPALAVERINFATGCVQEGEDPRCVSSSFELSLDAGDSSVGNALTITPAGYVLWTQDGYTNQAYGADSTLSDSYVLEGGSEIVGQVVVRNTPNGAPTAAADSGVSVQIGGSVITGTLANGNPRFSSKSLGTAEITKVVVAPGDHTYAFTFVVPADLDGVAIHRLNASIGQRHIGAGYGFIDGEGGSFFDLPHVPPVEEPAPAE